MIAAAEPTSARANDTIASQLYDVNASDPRSELIDRTGMLPGDVAQIGRLMQAFSSLRETEAALMSASQKYMKLSTQEMRALHFLIVAQNRGELVTPSMIAQHLNISKASTTKVLAHLETDGHIERRVHPDDRRAFAITITPETERSAMATVGKQQAQRFHAAARLSSEEREVVIRFLEDTRSELSLDGAAWAQPPQA